MSVYLHDLLTTFTHSTLEILFNTGFLSLGVLSLIAGFIRNKIGLIVIRAFSGIAGAVTIPSALNLIVHLFPQPAEQARALSVFGSVAAIGNGKSISSLPLTSFLPINL